MNSPGSSATRWHILMPLSGHLAVARSRSPSKVFGIFGTLLPRAFSSEMESVRLRFMIVRRFLQCYESTDECKIAEQVCLGLGLVLYDIAREISAMINQGATACAKGDMQKSGPAPERSTRSGISRRSNVGELWQRCLHIAATAVLGRGFEDVSRRNSSEPRDFCYTFATFPLHVLICVVAR